MLAAVPVLLGRDNDRLFAEPVRTLGQGMESPVSKQPHSPLSAPLSASPKSLESSLSTSRRVIFPSLHAVVPSKGACGKQQMPEARPLSPPKEDATTPATTRRLLSTTTPRKRRAELPSLTQSERELLLERLNSVLLLPPIVRSNVQLLKNHPSCPRRTTTDLKPHLPPILPWTPNLAKKGHVRGSEDDDSDSSSSSLLHLKKRHVFPSWELQLSDNWGLRPRHEEEVVSSWGKSREGGGEEKEEEVLPPPLRSGSSPIPPSPLPSILRKSSTSTNPSSSPAAAAALPLSSQSLQEHGKSTRALPLASPSSEGSDLPSLASSHSSDSIDDDDDNDRRNNHHNNNARVSFCPHVWVRLFVRSKRERERDKHTNWYSAAELDQFKADALERIQSYYDRCSNCNNNHNPQLLGRGNDRVLPTGTGRVVHVPAQPTRLLFSHQALRGDDTVGAIVAEPLPPAATTATTPSPTAAVWRWDAAVAREEVRRVLVVDPREVCRDLFAAAFRLWQPSAEICTVSTSAEALALLGKEEPNFDVVLTEERLGSQDLLGSGSTLLAGIAEESASARTKTVLPKRMPLLIGVTAQLDRDRERLERHGADVVWSKPPPTMSDDLQRDLLRLLLIKRGKSPPLDKQT